MEVSFSIDRYSANRFSRSSGPAMTWLANLPSGRPQKRTLKDLITLSMSRGLLSPIYLTT